MHHNIFQCHKKSLPCQRSLLHSLYAILFMQSVLISSQKPACVWFFVIDIFYVLIWNIAIWWRLRFSLSKVAPRGSPIAPILLDWCVTSHRGTTYVWSIQALTQESVLFAVGRNHISKVWSWLLHNRSVSKSCLFGMFCTREFCRRNQGVCEIMPLKVWRHGKNPMGGYDFGHYLSGVS